jgi:diguanylate cyclase (GGDEF)-like protein
MNPDRSIKPRHFVIILLVLWTGLTAAFVWWDLNTMPETSKAHVWLIHGIVWLLFATAIVWGGIRLQVDQDRLCEGENRFRELFDHMKSGVVVYLVKDGGQDFLIKDFNQAAEQIEQISKADVIGKSVLQVFPNFRELGLFEVLQRVWQDGTARYHPVSQYNKGRIEGWREHYVYKLPSGEVVAIYDDITESKKREEEVRILAITDPLTGLYNRRGFMALSEQQMRSATRTSKKMSMLFIDLDNMKKINDTWGHEEGDRALVTAANILRQTFRESDILGRIGGDEFAVLAVDAADDPEIVLGRLLERIAQHNDMPDRRYDISMSVGAAVYDPQEPCTLDELVSRADTLMYEQKKLSSGR